MSSWWRGLGGSDPLLLDQKNIKVCPRPVMEIAVCQPLQKLRDALMRRFQQEILFNSENAKLARARAEQAHIAGCVYRARACRRSAVRAE